jgi:multiple sugar transport system permease protein
MSKKPQRHRQQLSAMGFIAVPLLLMVTVELLPTLGVLWLSFTDYNPLDPSSWKTPVGLDHYQRLGADELAWQALRNTVYFVALYLPVAVFGGLVAAVLLNQPLRGRAFFRGVYFAPVVVSWVVAATMITWFIDPSWGLLTLVLESLGLDPLPAVLKDSDTAMPGIALVAIWKYFGYNVVIYLAGLQTIDSSLDESARVDGASAFQRFRYITLPMLRPVTAVVVILNLIQALRVFDPMLVMTNGGPNFSTTSMVLYMYRMAWDSLQFGYGSAIAVVLTVVVMAAASAQLAFFNRGSDDR